MSDKGAGAIDTSGLLPDLKRRFLKAASGSVGLNVVAAVAKLLATILLAKILGAQGFGAFAFALSLITLTAIPFRSGLPNLVARNVAVYLSQGNLSAMRGLLLRGNQLAIGLSLLAVGIAAAAAWFVDASQSAYSTFMIALALLPCVALSGIRRGALIGLHRPVLAQTPEQLIQPILFVALVASASLVLEESSFTPAVAMTLRVITVVAEFAVGSMLLIRYLPDQLRRCRATFETSRWLRGAVAFMLIGGMGTVNAEIGILILGMLGSLEDVGVYKSVVMLASMVTFVLQAFNTALLPLVAKLHTEGDKVRLQRMVTLSCRLVMICGLPAALMLIFFGQQCLGLLYGEEFSRGSTALAILSVGLLLNTMTGPVGLLLNAAGYELDTIKGKSFGMTLNVVLALILVPRWGLEGAAWASTCSLLTWNLILVMLVHRRLDLHPTILGRVAGQNNAP